jgi:hypothetical protein
MDVLYILINADMKFRNKKKSRYRIPAHFEFRTNQCQEYVCLGTRTVQLLEQYKII